MESNDKDYVSLVRIPRKWFYVFARIFSTLVILNLLLEVFWGWKLEALGGTVINTNVCSNGVDCWLLFHLLASIGGNHVWVCKVI